MAELRSIFSGSRGQSSTGDDSATTDASGEVRPDMSLGANIRVLGIGGGGNNAVTRMINAKIKGVEFIAANTDSQALYHNPAATKITLGRGITRGLGAGANPAIGKQAAEESAEEVKKSIEGADMLFLVGGAGGGTGSGALSVYAEMAKSMGILTIAVVTKPFSFEGLRRKKIADEAIESLKNKVDTLVVIPNDKVLSLIDKTTPLTEAFQVIDEVLLQAIEGIANLITVHGVVNVDFADVKSVMTDAGTALMGIGFGTGDSRAAEAARAAIDSPLLESSINGAKGLLLNITGGSDLSMFEIDEAARIVTEAADPEANIIFGAVIDENHTGEVKCTVVATGFDPATAGRTTATKASTFSRSSLGEAAATPAANTASNEAPAANAKYDQEELEVPAFMRKPLN